MSQTDQPTGGRRRAEGEPVVIKKYANRRLYNTASSSYVTLEHLAEMVRQGTDFVVYDAKTNDDLTRSVLTQIILEEENRGSQNLLPRRGDRPDPGPGAPEPATVRPGDEDVHPLRRLRPPRGRRRGPAGAGRGPRGAPGGRLRRVPRP